MTGKVEEGACERKEKKERNERKERRKRSLDF